MRCGQHERDLLRMNGTTREEANVGTPLLEGVDGLARGLQNDQLERHLQPLS